MPPIGRPWPRSTGGRSWSAPSPRSATGTSWTSCAISCAGPGSGAPSTAASGRRRGCPRRPCVPWPTCRASRWCRRPSSARRRPRIRPSATTSASSRRRWPAFTARAAPPAGPPCSASAPTTGRASARRMRGCCGARASAPPTRCSSAPSSACISGPGARWWARSGWAPPSSPSAPAPPARPWPPCSGRGICGRARSTAPRPTRSTSRRPRGARASTRGRSASASSSSRASRARAFPPPRRSSSPPSAGAAWTWGAWRR